MRSLSTAQQDLFAGAYRAHHVRCEVANGDGFFVDVTSRLVGWKYGEQVDDFHNPGSFSFSRGSGTDSLAPLVQSSTWNRLDDGTTYDPLLDLGRELVFYAATTENDASPTSGDWNEVYRATIRRVNDKSNPIQVDTWDRIASTLQDTTIEVVRAYGAADGSETLEEVQDALLDDNETGVSLWAPTSSGSGVMPYEQQREAVLQASRTLAEAIGWTVRSKWDEGTEAFRWKQYEPDRTATSSVWTFGPARYIAIPESDRALDDVRNVVEVECTDAETGARITVLAEDATSIARYGRRYMRLAFAEKDPINTQAKAEYIANAALSDLAEPFYTYGIELPYFWSAEIGDLYEFAANGTVFTADQTLAVVSVQHSGDGAGKGRTVLLCRGKPIGARKGWIDRSVKSRLLSGSAVEEYGLIDFREMAPSAAGKRRWGWTRRGRQVTDVWFAYKVYPAPWSDDHFADVKQFVAPIPDTQDWVEIDVPYAGQFGALWVEPRIDRGGALVVYHDEVIQRVKVEPVPASIAVDLSGSIVSAAVDLSLKLTAAAGSMPYPATALVYEDDETGTLIATLNYATDGTRTKTDDTALGGRTLPAEGARSWVAVVTDRTGTVYRDKVVFGALDKPGFEDVHTVLSVDLLSVDIYGSVLDPGGQGGTFEYWLPADAQTPADPTQDPTGSVVLLAADMPFTFGPTTVEDFDNVTTAGSALVVFLKFTSTDGRSTGAQQFTLDSSMQFLVDIFGQLRAGSVHNGLVLAEEYRPYFNGTGAPTLTVEDYGTDRYFDSSALQPYLHNGSAWVEDDSTPSISYAPILVAGVVTAEVIAAGAVRAKLVGAERITAENITSLTLESGQYISSEVYTSGSVGWRINASGSAEFNDVVIRGELDGATGSFTGSIDLVGGTNNITFVDGTSGTTVAQISGENVGQGLNLSAGSADIILQDFGGGSGGDITLGAAFVSVSGDLSVSGDISGNFTGTIAGSQITGTIPASLIDGEVAEADHADTATSLTLGSWGTITDGLGNTVTVYKQ